MYAICNIMKNIIFIFFIVFFCNNTHSMTVDCRILPIIQAIVEKNDYDINKEEITENYHVGSVRIASGSVENDILFNGNVKIPHPLIENIWFLESTQTTITLSYLFSSNDDDIIVKQFNLEKFYPTIKRKNKRLRLRLHNKSSSDKIFDLYYETVFAGVKKTLLIENINFNEYPYFTSIECNPDALSKTEVQPIEKENHLILKNFNKDSSTKNQSPLPPKKSSPYFTVIILASGLLIFTFFMTIHVHKNNLTRHKIAHIF